MDIDENNQDHGPGVHVAVTKKLEFRNSRKSFLLKSFPELKVRHDLRLPNGHRKDLRNECLSTVQNCRFPGSKLTPPEAALSRSFPDPKQVQSLEIIQLDFRLFRNSSFFVTATI